MSGNNSSNYYYSSNINNNNNSYCDNPFKKLNIIASGGNQTKYSSDKYKTIYSRSDCGSTFNSSGFSSMMGERCMW